jgi:endoglucanase
VIGMTGGITRRTATALLLAAAASPALAAAPKPPIKVPTRGFALPDWLSDNPRAPTTEALDRLRGLGFETIRLPVDPTLVSGDFSPRVAEALAVTLDHGFKSILDMHPGGDLDPDRIDAAWALLAGIVSTTPADRVYVELLNEPPLDPAPWADLAERLAATVRLHAPDHTLIWGPASVQGIWELADQRPPADPNLIASVHYYTPMGFTHQGENWDDSPLARLCNLPFPTNRKSPEVTAVAEHLSADDRKFLDGEFAGKWNDAHIAEDFATLGKWSRRHKLPVMLGEFGVLNFCVDAISRANWISSVRAAAEANGAGWVYWEADQGFGFMGDRTDANSIDPAIAGALLS